MSFILSIDTAVAEASVCLSDDTEIKGLKTNHQANESAAWLHTAIQQLLHETRVPINQLATVAVSAGPGSYTGLRVGMAAAKRVVLCVAYSAHYHQHTADDGRGGCGRTYRFVMSDD